MDTSSGATGGLDALPIDGNSTCPGLMSGAVTMNITSSTSITSMYGTTLIWFMSRRVLRRSISMIDSPSFHPSLLALTLKDVGKFFHERIESRRKPVKIARETIVGHDRGNR